MADQEGGFNPSGPNAEIAGVSAVLRLHIDRDTPLRELAQFKEKYRQEIREIADIAAQELGANGTNPIPRLGAAANAFTAERTRQVRELRDYLRDFKTLQADILKTANNLARPVRIAAPSTRVTGGGVSGTASTQEAAALAQVNALLLQQQGLRKNLLANAGARLRDTVQEIGAVGRLKTQLRDLLVVQERLAIQASKGGQAQAAAFALVSRRIADTRRELQALNQAQKLGLIGTSGKGTSGGLGFGQVAGASFLGNFGAASALGALRNVTQEFKQLLDIAIDFNARMETARVGLRAFVRDNAEATKITEGAIKLATETSFSLPDVLKGTKKLLAMGIAAEDVLGVVRDLGAAVAAIGGDTNSFNRAVLAFGQISAKPKLIAQDIRQLAEVGIPAFKILQEELGLTADQVFNIGRANISSIDGVKALRRGLQDLYGGALLTQLNTYAGRLANLNDIVTIFLGRFAGPLTKEATKFFEDLGNVLSDPGVLRSAEALGNTIGGIVQSLRLELLGERGSFLEFMANLPTQVDVVGAKLLELKTFIDNFKVDFSSGDIFGFEKSAAFNEAFAENVKVFTDEAAEKARQSAIQSEIAIDIKAAVQHVDIDFENARIRDNADKINPLLAQLNEKFSLAEEELLTEQLSAGALKALDNFTSALETKLASAGELGSGATAHIAERFKEEFLRILVGLGDNPSVERVQAAIDHLGKSLNLEGIFEDEQIVALGKAFAGLYSQQSLLTRTQGILKTQTADFAELNRKETRTIEDKKTALDTLTNARRAESEANQETIRQLRDRAEDTSDEIDKLTKSRKAQKDLFDLSLQPLEDEKFDTNLLTKQRDQQFDKQLRDAQTETARLHSILDPVTNSLKVAHEQASNALEDLKVKQSALSEQWKIINENQARIQRDLQDKRGIEEAKYTKLIEAATNAEKAHARVIKDANLDLREQLRAQDALIDAIDDKYRAELRIKDLLVDDQSDAIRAAQAEQNKRDLEFAKRIAAARAAGDTEGVARLREERDAARTAFEESQEVARAELQVRQDAAEAAKDIADEEARAAREKKEDLQRTGQANLDRLTREGDKLSENTEKLETERDVALSSYDRKIAIAKAFAELLGRSQQDQEALANQELAQAQALETAAQRRFEAQSASDKLVFENAKAREEAITNEKRVFDEAQQDKILALDEEIERLGRIDSLNERTYQQLVKPVQDRLDKINETITAEERRERDLQTAFEKRVKPQKDEIERLELVHTKNERLRQDELDKTKRVEEETQKRIDAYQKEIDKFAEQQKAVATAKALSDKVRAEQEAGATGAKAGLPDETPAVIMQLLREMGVQGALLAAQVSSAKSVIQDAGASEKEKLAAGEVIKQAAITIERLLLEKGIKLPDGSVAKALTPANTGATQVGFGETARLITLLQLGDVEAARRLLQSPGFIEQMRKSLFGDFSNPNAPLSGSERGLERLLTVLEGMPSNEQNEALRKDIRSVLGVDASGKADPRNFQALSGLDGKLTDYGKQVDLNTQAVLDNTKAILQSIDDGKSATSKSVGDVFGKLLNQGDKSFFSIGEGFAEAAADRDKPTRAIYQAAVRGQLLKILDNPQALSEFLGVAKANPKETELLLTSVLPEGQDFGRLEVLRGLLEAVRLAGEQLPRKLSEGVSAGVRGVDDPASTVNSSIVAPVQAELDKLPTAADTTAKKYTRTIIDEFGRPQNSAEIATNAGNLANSAITGFNDKLGLTEGGENVMGVAAKELLGERGMGLLGMAESQAAIKGHGEKAAQALEDGAMGKLGLSEKGTNVFGVMADSATGKSGLGKVASEENLAEIVATTQTAGEAFVESLRKTLSEDDEKKGKLSLGSIAQQGARSFLDSFKTTMETEADATAQAGADALADALAEKMPKLPNSFKEPNDTQGQGGQGLLNPVRGAVPVTNPFGAKGANYGAKGHTGIDINAPGNDMGSEIRAAADGVVKLVSFPVTGDSGGKGVNYGYGNYIVIDHLNGFSTLYAHLSGTKGPKVKVGQRVKRGQVIAYMGNTGNSFGSHLHFEVRRNSGNHEALDPTPFLEGGSKSKAFQSTASDGTGGSGGILDSTSQGRPTDRKQAAVQLIQGLIEGVREAGGDFQAVWDAFFAGNKTIAEERLKDLSKFAQEEMQIALETLNAALQLLGGGSPQKIADALRAAGFDVADFNAQAQQGILGLTAPDVAGRQAIPDSVKQTLDLIRKAILDAPRTTEGERDPQVESLLNALFDASPTALLSEVVADFEARLLANEVAMSPALAALLEQIKSITASEAGIFAQDVQGLLFGKGEGFAQKQVEATENNTEMLHLATLVIAESAGISAEQLAELRQQVRIWERLEAEWEQIGVNTGATADATAETAANTGEVVDPTAQTAENTGAIAGSTGTTAENTSPQAPAPPLTDEMKKAIVDALSKAGFTEAGEFFKEQTHLNRGNIGFPEQGAPDLGTGFLGDGGKTAKTIEDFHKLLNERAGTTLKDAGDLLVTEMEKSLAGLPPEEQARFTATEALREEVRIRKELNQLLRGEPATPTTPPPATPIPGGTGGGGGGGRPVQVASNGSPIINVYEAHNPQYTGAAVAHAVRVEERRYGDRGMRGRR